MNLTNLSNALSNVTALALSPTNELAVVVTQSDENPETNNTHSWFNALANAWKENCASSANELMTQAQASFCNYLEDSMEDIEAMNREDETGSTSSTLVAIGAGLGLGMLMGYVVRKLVDYRHKQAAVPPQ